MYKKLLHLYSQEKSQKLFRLLPIVFDLILALAQYKECITNIYFLFIYVFI